MWFKVQGFRVQPATSSAEPGSGFSSAACRLSGQFNPISDRINRMDRIVICKPKKNPDNPVDPV